MAPALVSRYNADCLGEPVCQLFNIHLHLIQQFYKYYIVDEADDDGDDDDVMEGPLVVGLVVWKCQCSMHEQQHSKCSNIPHKIFSSILNVQIFLIKYPTTF